MLEPLDTQASVPQVLDLSSIKPWSGISSNLTESKAYGSQKRMYEVCPFSFSSTINKKVALWAGDLTLLACHGIVNTTNESLSDRNDLSLRILWRAGPQLKQQMKQQLRGCRTGDAKLSKGYNLPARYVIHTVGPKYNQRYQTAAESALFSSYFRTFQLCKEHGIRTLGLPPINSIRRGYPPHEGAHIALRVARRFLEKFPDQFDLIIFTVEDVDVGIYEILMPLYFPRSEQEEEYASYYLPEDVGGENGEPVIPERQIRIADNPMNARFQDEVDRSVDLSSGLDSSVVVGKSSFAKMQGDIDRRWNNPRNLKPEDALTGEIQRRNRYERLLRRSRVEDLTEIANLRCLYINGEDRNGRPVVVFVGKRFNWLKVNTDKALLYFIHILDPIVERDYVVFYFHALTTNENHPPLNFLRYIFDIVEYKYKKNLRAFYVIHPTIWTKILIWWFTTFSASAIKDKVYYLGGVEYLQNAIPLDQLQVPSFIMDYDFKVNGVRYCQINEART